MDISLNLIHCVLYRLEDISGLFLNSFSPLSLFFLDIQQLSQFLLNRDNCLAVSLILAISHELEARESRGNCHLI